MVTGMSIVGYVASRFLGDTICSQVANIHKMVHFHTLICIRIHVSSAVINHQKFTSLRISSAL